MLQVVRELARMQAQVKVIRAELSYHAVDSGGINASSGEIARPRGELE